MRCLALISVFCFLVAGSSAQYRDGRFFHTRRFWDGFERGLTDAGTEVQKRLNSNLETTMDHLSNLGKSIGEISRKIEDQVQESLPDWLQNDQNRRRESLSPQDAPIEAIEGTLGMEGLDDGLQVYFKGDSNQAELPEPHIIPSDYDLFSEGSSSLDTDREDAEVLPPPSPPRNNVPLFDLRFGFNGGNRFPMFPRYPSFPMPPFFSVGGRSQPWWKGDNVCKDVLETDESEGSVDSTVTTEEGEAATGEGGTDEGRGFFFSQMEVKSCSEGRNQYSCTTRTRRRGINRTIKETYKCCHGYIKEEQGCTKVDMVPLDESLKGLGLTEFVSLCENADVMDLLHSNNLTVFAPSNEAIEDFTSDLTETNELDISENVVFRKKRQTDQSPQIQEVVYSHMFDGFLYTADMEDEQIIPSMASDSTIRINIYSRNDPPIITANCAKITTVNQHSTNGVVHSLDRVMQPAVESIADIVGSDPQFSILKKLISTSGMLEDLRQAGQMTLLAPTDAAFSTLSAEELENLLETSACLPSVLKNHILPNVICSAAITNPEAKTLNLLEKFLMVELTETGKLFVEDAQIVAKDIMATNGVIHIIDKPILPTEAKPVMEVLRHRNLTRFLELLELAEMKSELDALRDSTVFVPSNEAIEGLDEEVLNELKTDKPRLQETLRYHITKAPFIAEDIFNNHHMDTSAGHPLRINLYRGQPQIFSLSSILNPRSSIQVTAGCGIISLRDGSRACGANVHVVDSFLQPAKLSVMEKLQNDADFSIFSKMVQESTLAEELSGEGPFTILAPSDHVFKTLPEAELESLLDDPELKDDLVHRHVLREHVCCSGIAPNAFSLHQSVSRTAQGSTVHLHQTPGGLLKAGFARITHCSEPARNGLVHTVNNLYVEPHVPQVNTNIQRWDSSFMPFIRN